MLEDKQRPPSHETQAGQAPLDKQWQSLDSFTEDERFIEVMKQQFPREAAVLKRAGKMSRRQFINLMGASLVMGGLSLTGCVPSPRDHEEILPFARQPEAVIPGKPLFFASSMVLGGYATGVLVETHAGRPTRIDGNPNHPASLGGSGVYQLASILELYNPTRSTEVRRNNERSTWDEFATAIENLRGRLGSGAGLRLLSEGSTSPTLIAQFAALKTQYPDAKWYQYDPVNRDAVVNGAQIAFGEVVETVYHFDKADVVLALDADFLTAMPGSLRYARDFAAKRKVHEATGEPTMSRLYSVESTPTNTSAMADHRLSLSAAQIGRFVLALADALGVDGGQAIADAPWDAAWLASVVADLQAHAGASIVIAGDEQPAAVHALVHAINAALNNAGQAMTYLPALTFDPTAMTDQLTELVGEMSNGQVQALFIVGGNPVYNAPADVAFSDALGRVPFSIHVSLYNDETSQSCTWHVPQAHFTEGWSDSRAYDGTASIVQPPILPLYSSARSDVEMLALIAGDTRSGYEIIRDTWQAQYSGADFDGFWRRSLHDGVVPDSAPQSITPTLSGDIAAAAAELATVGDGLQVNFRAHASIYDGRFANNSWLHEVPHPLTKISWDTVAMMSQATATSLGVSNGDLLNLTYQGRTTQAPAWVTAGHADDCVTLSLGYGRGIGGDVEAGLSFNAYAIRTAASQWWGAGLQVQATGNKHRLALTQKELTDRGTDPVRSGTLVDFITNPDFVQEGHKKYDATFLSEYDYAGYAWGMTIDLTSCMGCNACVIACQSENSIPVVGKSEVLQEREMHWIRVDRYHENGETKFQPVPCMHCENAPCEQVCPVQATVHDHEGLNLMVYNRCVGTRYCSANCPYGVRRFNFLDYIDQTPILAEQRNPNVSVRERGVMEKCTYCVQRINAGRITASNEDRRLADGEVLTACAAACPTQAIKFGNINDPNAVVSKEKAQPHHYGLLEELNTSPRTTYLARLTNPNAALNTDSSDGGEG
jgi:molybdopterin-containing oxidoreductase family iron-sulfur binding subunit